MDKLTQKAKKLGLVELIFCSLFGVAGAVCTMIVLIMAIDAGFDFNGLGGAFGLVFVLLFLTVAVIGLVMFAVGLTSYLLNRKVLKSTQGIFGGKKYFIAFSIIYYVLAVGVIVFLALNFSLPTLIVCALIEIFLIVFATMKLQIAIKISKAIKNGEKTTSSEDENANLSQN